MMKILKEEDFNKENFEKVGKSKFSKKNFAQISFGNRTYAKFSKEIIGFDANILVDMVYSKDFKEEIKTRVTFNALRIYTTEIALGEARHTLIKKKGRIFDEATEELKNIMGEFSIEKINHEEDYDKLGEEWVSKVKEKMFIKKFSTFPNDCKILSNLYGQKGLNVYYTEDKDIEEAVKILGIKVNIRIIPEAEDLNEAKIRDFFKKKSRNFYKKHKLS